MINTSITMTITRTVKGSRISLQYPINYTLYNWQSTAPDSVWIRCQWSELTDDNVPHWQSQYQQTNPGIFYHHCPTATACDPTPTKQKQKCWMDRIKESIIMHAREQLHACVMLDCQVWPLVSADAFKRIT